MNNKCSYIICTNPRSGSTLLCDLLSDTEIAGRPNSFFLKEFYSEWAKYLNISMHKWADDCEFDQLYLSAVLQEGSATTSVFGMRLMWESLASLSNRLDSFYPRLADDNSRFQSAFGRVKYIYLKREDKVAQAVSLFTAEQSGLWHINNDNTERERLKLGVVPEYNADKILERVVTLKENDIAWCKWFDKQDIEPLFVKYEELSFNPQAVLEKIITFIGLKYDSSRIITPRTAKMANSRNLEWITRFHNENIS